MKRLICLILSTIFIFTSFPVTIYADAVDTDVFNGKVAELLSDYSGYYYSSIKIDIENNTMQVDENPAINLEKYDIDYSSLESKEMLIPVVPVMKATGHSASLNDETGELVVDGESYNLYDNNVDESEVIHSNIEDGIEYIYTEDNTKIETPVAYANEEQAEENFNLETEISDGIITITNKFQTKRLVLQTKYNTLLNNTYNADEVINNRGYYVLQYSTEDDAKLAYEKFQNDSSIDYVVCDKVTSTFGLSNRTGANTVNSDRYKKYLANNGKTSVVKVAVIDTGCETTHEFLKGRLVTGYNVYKNNTKVTDGHGHGTHVSGIIADNSPSCVKIMPIKSIEDSGNGTDLAIKQGIDYAVSKGVKVINMSIGGVCEEENCLIEQAVKKAIKAGVTVCVAAGNESKDCANVCPAKINDCITVSSYEGYGAMSSFTNFGDSVDLCAPGTNIESCFIGNSYETLSGTSMATPFVTAAAAMQIVNNSSLKPSGVLSKLKETCADMYIKGWDRYTGAGLLNFTYYFDGNINPASIIYESKSEIELNYFNNCTWYKSGISMYGNSEIDETVCTDYTFTSVSTNENVATFDGMYYIPHGSGTATITVSLSNGNSFSVNVKMKKIEVWTDYASNTYGGGKGTKDSPYLIYNAKQLAKIALNERTGKLSNGKYFKLMNDIDLSGKYWISIANLKYNDNFIIGSFTYGSTSINFDGNNHKIINMTTFYDPLVSAWSDWSPVNRQWYEGNGGLFMQLANSTIKNLGIENAYSINGDGILAQSLYENTTIDKCYTSGYCKGSGFALEALNYNIKISNCYSSATVGSSGLISYVYSSSSTPIEIISNSFFCGEQLGNDTMEKYGGFINIVDSYTEKRHTKIYNCFNASNVISGFGIAQINNNSVISKCYYNSLNSCGVKVKQNNCLNSTYARSESFFKNKVSFTTASNWNSKYPWDFTNVWAINPSINNGFPYLKKNIPFNKEKQKTNTWLDYVATNFAGGRGTKNQPYLISNAQQLARLAHLYRYGGGINTYFSITKDIDLSEHSWYPIGGGESLSSTLSDTYNKYYFQGNIEGNNHTIKGLNVSTNGDYIGFVAKMNCGTISNLTFENVTVSGNDYVGGVCGAPMYNNTISNCIINGTISGNNYVGSIAGSSNGGTIIRGCYSTAEIKATSIGAGISGEGCSLIEGCAYIGTGCKGIVDGGRNEIKDCYSIGTSLAYISNNVLENCYEIYNNQSTYNYYIRRTKANSSVINGNQSTFKNKETFSSFDFENVWDIDKSVNNGYPYIKKQNYFTETPNGYWEDFASEKFSNGNGTKESPYIINTAEDLALAHKIWNVYTNKYFSLKRDIDLSGKWWNSSIINGAKFVVKMYFEGNGHTIRNLYLNNGEGLFDIANEGIISNLKLENVRGTTCSGLVSAVSEGGVVKNCSVNGSINAPIDIRNISFECGGISGNNYGRIERCSFNGTISGADNIGPIAGYSSGVIRNCYSVGVVRGDGNGICGNNSFGSIEKCYSSALIIDGLAIANISYKDCYSCGEDTGDTLSKNTKEEMMSSDTYVNWNFADIWEINDGEYPHLQPVKNRIITYVLNGGTLAANSPKSYKSSFGIVLKNPTKNGAVFEGWYLDKSFTKKAPGNIGIVDYGDIKLYAKWTPAFYVKFYGNGSTSGTMSRQTIKRDTSTALKNNAYKRTGYTFKGWAKSKTGKVVYKNQATVKNSVSTGSTLNLYAIWSPNTYNVKFNGNGIKIGNTKLTGKKYDSSFKLPKVQWTPKRGIVFGGWGLDPDRPKYVDGQTVKNLTSVNGKTVTLYACWLPYGNYKIKYNVNGGKMPSKYPKNYVTGKGCTLPKPTKKGYTFEGWYTDKACKKNKTTVIKPWIEGNKTYYAKWKPNTYKVKFDNNGGTGSMSTESFKYGSSKALTKCTFTAPRGKVFAGWAKSKTGTPVYVNGQSVKNLTSKNGKVITFYARYVVPKTYKISYIMNGGKQPSKYPKTFKSGTGCTLPKPTKKGYTFAGWYKDSKFTGSKVTKVKPWITSNQKFYAKWVKNK